MENDATTVGWRMIELSTNSAAFNMALDESIRTHIARGESLPTIRFYRWQPSAVSIGYFQSVEQEVNQKTCQEWGIDVVRRETGGGAVYHDFEGEITYSVIAPEKLFPSGITQSYHQICGWITNGLSHLGLFTEFKPINDIVLNGKKISGNAQTRRSGMLHQHGTLLYDLDVEKMFSMLRVGEAKVSDKLIASVKERVTCLKEHSNASLVQTYDALKKGFCENKRIESQAISSSELALAQKLAVEKFRSHEWTFLRQ